MKNQLFHCLLLVCLFTFLAALTAQAENKQVLSKTSRHQKTSEDTAPALMLAGKWEPGMEISGWLMSEKLDGVRAYWNGKNLLSRTGMIFCTPSWFTENFPDMALDGELWMGRQNFSNVLSMVLRKSHHDGWKSIRYMIFEAPQAPGSFEERIELARRRFRENSSSYAVVIEQEVCRDEKHLLQRLKEIEALNGEGIILREPGSAYVSWRTQLMLKVKNFSEAEAVVVEHLPGSGRNEGRLGAVMVELPNGKHFAIGSGFSDEERLNPPPIGSTITFKHQGLTKNGIPRFASFKAVREGY